MDGLVMWPTTVTRMHNSLYRDGQQIRVPFFLHRFRSSNSDWGYKKVETRVRVGNQNIENFHP